MANRFRPRVSTSMTSLKKYLGLGSLTFALASTATQLPAENIDSRQLQPYTAEYKTTARGMSLDLTRKLEVHPDGSYKLTNGGKILVVGFREVSSFTVEGDRIIPKSYVYEGTGLINRRREVHFTPGSDTIRSLYKDKWYDLPYSENTLDRMSQQEQLRLTLLNDPTPRDDIAFRVADGKRVKDYTFEYVGEDVVQTPMGPIKALHFKRPHDDPDRKSDTWVAPELGYLMVKTVHIEDDKPVEVILTDAKIEEPDMTAK